MKLSNYIVDLGRAVAYYPKLKKVTGSTTATILLCQFLYWSDKTSNGWIYKDSNEIEEETGLTANEQRTAKKCLEDANLLEYEFKRWERKTAYRINQESLNSAWETLTGESIKPIVKPKASKEEALPLIPVDKSSDEIREERIEKQVTKKSILDAYMEAPETEGYKRAIEFEKIYETLQKRLKINVSGKRWESFIDMVYNRGKKGESLDTFITWAQKENFNALYWTPEKMITIWPTAFAEPDKPEFIQKWEDEGKPTVKEERIVVPMPESLRKRRI